MMMKDNSYSFCLVIGSLTIGGAERSMVEFANFLISRNHSVVIVLLSDVDSVYKLNSNVKIIKPKRVSKRNNLLLAFELGYYIRTTLMRMKPDFVYSVAMPTLFLFSTLGCRFPKIISIRCNPINHYLIDPFPLFLKRIAMKHCSGIIAQTQFAATELYRMTSHPNIKIIPNYVRSIQEFGVMKKKYIINVGRLIPEKGQKYLLQSFAQLNIPNEWRLRIVGGGRLENKLKEYAEVLGISNRVDFLGYQQNVDELLQESEIFVFTSISEGFPNSLLEAMATPLACISFDCNAGPADIIKHMENGILVEQSDVLTLTQSIQLLVDNIQLRETLASNAIKTREKYHINKVAESYFEFITSFSNSNLRNF